MLDYKTLVYSFLSARGRLRLQTTLSYPKWYNTLEINHLWLYVFFPTFWRNVFIPASKWKNLFYMVVEVTEKAKCVTRLYLGFHIWYFNTDENKFGVPKTEAAHCPDILE